MNDILEDCIITHTDAKIKTKYSVVVGEDSYHPGIDIYGDLIYCPCKGMVIQSCREDDFFKIIVQYSDHISLGFSHLKERYVHSGEIIDSNRCIGVAAKYVHFEYLTVEPTYPEFIVRIPPDCVLYKHDPNLILNHIIIFDESDSYSGDIEVFGATAAELSNNRG